MLTILKDWPGQVTINDIVYNSIQDVQELPKGAFHIILGKSIPETSKQAIQDASGAQEYTFTVKAYMTKPASPEFDFMAKWNNNNPMPMRTMTGVIEKETRGMVYVKLHGQGKPVITCMRCGKELKNPISRHYGIGPECIQKIGLHFDIEDVESIKEALKDITWEGWIIKSAITEQVLVDSADNNSI